MICVTIFVNSGHYKGLEMLGHAGNAVDHAEGQELVCSAVSALTINMANSMEQFTDDSFKADMDDARGLFRFHFSNTTISSEAQLLMNSLIFGLQDIEETYGEPYIKIRFEEV